MKNYSFLLNWLTIVLFAGCLSLQTACSDDTEDNAGNNAFSVKVKVLNMNDADISATGVVESAILYVFDDKDTFIGKIHLSQKTIAESFIYDLYYDHADSIKVLTWGNVTADNISSSSLIPESSKISDLQFTVKDPGTTNELYWGKKTIKRASNQVSIPQVEMKTAISRVSVAVKGITVEKADKYHCIIKSGIARSFNYQGEPTEEYENFKIALATNKEGLLSAVATVYPSNKNVTVELYKNDTLLSTISEDAQSLPITLVTGMETNIIFTFAE